MHFWLPNSAEVLTWHNGGIPEEEVWVKLGVDKGGGSFKMSYQVCSCRKLLEISSN